MFKWLQSKEKKYQHFIKLIENEDYATIIAKIQTGYRMEEKEKNDFNKLVFKKIQKEGITFLSNLYKEGYEINDDWILYWAKTKKFINNYNLPVYGNEYFKERLESIAPEILSYYMERIDNLSMSVTNAYKVGFTQAVEILMAVKNYSKIIEHIESTIPDTKLLQYIQKIRTLNKTIEKKPSFYNELGDTTKVSDVLNDLQYIMEKRIISKKDSRQKILPNIIKQYIQRIHSNYEKCIESKEYLKEDTITILQKIRNTKLLFLINEFKESKDQEVLTKELAKIDTAISSVLIGINKKKITELQTENTLNKIKI